MTQSGRSPERRPKLPDPEVSAGGVSQRKFLGVPVWAAAAGAVVLAAVMYLLMIGLT